LTEISIPGSVKSIGDKAFYNCEKLTDVYYGGRNFINIGEENDCLKNANIHCEEFDYTYLEDGTIEITGCDPQATSIIVPEEIHGVPVTSIGENAFSDRSYLISVVLPDSIVHIKNHAFYHNYLLNKVILSNNIIDIGDYAFSHCYKLDSINIPLSVTEIGDNAFFICDNLTDVYYAGTESDWNQINNNSLLNATIHYNASAPSIAITGDSTGDNIINVEDAVLTLTMYAQKSAGLEVKFSDTQTTAADIDGDGIVSVEDAVAILTYYAKQSAGLQPTWAEIIG